jgi:hypothetical protein
VIDRGQTDHARGPADNATREPTNHPTQPNNNQPKSTKPNKQQSHQPIKPTVACIFALTKQQKKQHQTVMPNEKKKTEANVVRYGKLSGFLGTIKS